MKNTTMLELENKCIRMKRQTSQINKNLYGKLIKLNTTCRGALSFMYLNISQTYSNKRDSLALYNDKGE